MTSKNAFVISNFSSFLVVILRYQPAYLYRVFEHTDPYQPYPYPYPIPVTAGIRSKLYLSN